MGHPAAARSPRRLCSWASARPLPKRTTTTTRTSTWPARLWSSCGTRLGGTARKPPSRCRPHLNAPLDRKQTLAEVNKAAAVIYVNDRTEVPAGDKLMGFAYLSSATPGTTPALQVRAASADNMVMQSSLGTTLADIEKAIDRDLKRSAAGRLDGEHHGWGQSELRHLQERHRRGGGSGPRRRDRRRRVT